MRRIVFDTEATDLTPGQICQLSYLMLEKGEVTGKNMFFSVDEMGEGAQGVHGMSMEDLRALSGGERFEDRAREIFEDFQGASLLIGHNVSADDRYLRVEFERLGMRLPKIKTFCTMNHFTSDTQLARKANIGRPKPPKLGELCAHFDISDEWVSQKEDEWFGGGGGAHDARFDAVATYLCLLRATEKGRIRGVL